MRLSLAIGVFLLPPMLGCATEEPVDAPDFDISRWRDLGIGTFEPHRVTDAHRLHDVLEAGTVQEDTAVLVTQTAGGALAFVTDQMSFHHLAQGETEGEPWLVSF